MSGIHENNDGIISAAQLLKEIEEELKAYGIENSRTEARIIVEHFTNRDYSEIISGLADPLSPVEVMEVRLASKIRLMDFPLALIVGYADFYGIKFHIERGVLVPRPETETLVDYALKIITYKFDKPPKILDLYTGSGNIILSIALKASIDKGIGVDIDPVAIICAENNAISLKCNTVNFINEDVSEFFGTLNEKFDLITANPPYIPTGDIPSLQKEIREHENQKAIDGGADGLYHYRILAKSIPGNLESNGYFLCEIGFNQKNSVAEIFSEWSKVDFIKDLSGHDRVLVARP
ncbi:MAG: peptide chain release factor N(5)-glutamine methyltransferase [bacterium]